MYKFKALINGEWKDVEVKASSLAAAIEIMVLFGWTLGPFAWADGKPVRIDQ